MNKRTLFIARISIILALTLVIQMAGFPQPITGPLVNTMLFITASLFGTLAGVILGSLTPLVALIRGQLPPILAPMVVFIIGGNAILVLTYNVIVKSWENFIGKTSAKMSQLAGILVASVAKFVFLTFAVRIVLPVIFNVSIGEKFAFLMTTPQLITAILGGIIAVIILTFLNRQANHQLVH